MFHWCLLADSSCLSSILLVEVAPVQKIPTKIILRYGRCAGSWLFPGTQGFHNSWCVTIPGLPAIIHILHQLVISSPFLSCLRPASSSGRGKRQQFQSNSRFGSKVLYARRGNPTQIKHLRRNQHEKSMPKKIKACQKKVRHRKSVVRQASPCLRYVVKKKGYTTKRCASATFHHLFYALVWFGMVWFGMVWFDLIWFGLVWYGLVCYGLVWFGLVWFGLVWFGLVWFGLVWFGLVWLGFMWRVPWFGLFADLCGNARTVLVM